MVTAIPGWWDQPPIIHTPHLCALSCRTCCSFYNYNSFQKCLVDTFREVYLKFVMWMENTDTLVYLLGEEKRWVLANLLSFAFVCFLVILFLIFLVCWISWGFVWCCGVLLVLVLSFSSPSGPLFLFCFLIVYLAEENQILSWMEQAQSHHLVRSYC